MQLLLPLFFEKLDSYICVCVCVCVGRPVNYVLLWLSVVGPVVGLDVPLKYCTQLHPSSPSSSEPD